MHGRRSIALTSNIAVVEQAADVVVLQQIQQQPAIGGRQQVREADQNLCGRGQTHRIKAMHGMAEHY